MLLIVLSLIATVLCLYGMYVEQQLTKDPKYKAVCDLSDSISCTKTFKSSYGALLGVPNSYVGLVFYTAMLVLALLGMKSLVFIGALGATAASLYLGYIQYGKLKIFCPLCTALYLVNLLLLIMAWV